MLQGGTRRLCRGGRVVVDHEFVDVFNVVVEIVGSAELLVVDGDDAVVGSTARRRAADVSVEPVATHHCCK